MARRPTRAAKRRAIAAMTPKKTTTRKKRVSKILVSRRVRRTPRKTPRKPTKVAKRQTRAKTPKTQRKRSTRKVTSKRKAPQTAPTRPIKRRRMTVGFILYVFLKPFDIFPFSFHEPVPTHQRNPLTISRGKNIRIVSCATTSESNTKIRNPTRWSK